MYYQQMIIRWNKLIFLYLLIFSLLLVSGCGGREQTGQRTQPDVNTITVTDCVGRQVTIPAKIERIACLCPESGHALAMFGKGDEIVAVVGGMQRDVILTDMYPAIKDLPVPKSSGVINIEELIRSRPDVVFVKADTWRSEAEVDKMNKSKIPFIVIDYNNIKEQQYAIDVIGKVVGESGIAAKYRDYYQKRVDLVRERVAGIPMDKKVRIYHSINEATRTDNRRTLAADWTQAAGAINVSAAENLKMLEGNYFASLEQILLWNPEVILVNEPLVVNYIMTNKQWSSLKAVKNHKVMPLPNGISRWGHPSSLETPLAVLWTAQTLYPDKFTDVNMVEEVKYFYKEFFNYQLSDEVAHKVLSGVGMRQAKQ